ncbi:MAG: response regulator [Elusimicrobiales bacterium]|nr:response regulator [Elusimicrobiales bacterium]
MQKNTKPFDILLIEDNEDDVVIIKRVFKKANITNKLYIANSGQNGIDFLNHQGKYTEETSSVPGLILLDINMPGITGFDVLKKLKTNPKHKRIPIIMLTTSGAEEDISKSYENGACSFITKPVDFNDFVKTIESFDFYWTHISKIPR